MTLSVQVLLGVLGNRSREVMTHLVPMAVDAASDVAAPAAPAAPQRGRPWIGRGLRAVRGTLAVAVPTALFAAHASLYGRWEVDDAGITFAYARSVATGAGPVLQPGLPPVEGFSDPAWLGLLVLGRWMGLFDHGAWFGVPDYVAYPKALGLLLVAGMFGAFLAAATKVSRFPAAATLAAGCACAAIPSLVIWCVSGLENALLAAAVVTLGAVLVRSELPGARAAVACGLLAALAGLTRPEGVIYAAAYPLALLVVGTRILPAARSALLSVVAFAVPYGAYLAYRLATFGEWLPTTAVAKSQGLPTIAGFARVAQLGTYAGWLAVLAGAIVTGAALGRRVPGIAVLTVPLGLGLVAFGVLIPDWMEQYRFATPVWALAPLVVALSAAAVVPELTWRGRAAAALVTAAAVAISGNGFVSASRTFAAAPTAPMCLIVTNTGREFNGYLAALGRDSGTFFAPEIGGGALTGRALLVDGAGLAEPTIARLWKDKNPAGIRDYVLDVVKPTFVRAHGSFRPIVGLDADPRFARDYVEISPSPNGGGNWIRRELVPDEATMARLRAVSAQALAADTRQRATPQASCGDRLLVGSTNP
jgi:hypothetical protein